MEENTIIIPRDTNDALALNLPLVEEKHYSILNLGPTHPATHGIFQNILTMDGEKIVSSEQTVVINTRCGLTAYTKTWLIFMLHQANLKKRCNVLIPSFITKMDFIQMIIPLL